MSAGFAGMFTIGCAGLAVVVVAIIVALIALFNRMVVMRNRVDNSWAQIEVQLKRRYDLIPNLVETVKGYAAHESGTFEAVVQARSFAMNPHGIAEQGQAENMLSGALKSLFAVAEAYPDLKANQNFLDLQEQLADAENKIAYARQFYNDTVMSFNTLIQSFPAMLFAAPFGFSVREYFEAEAAAANAPQVKF
jgi:LemA protein